MKISRLIAAAMFVAAFATFPAVAQQRQGANSPATSATPAQQRQGANPAATSGTPTQGGASAMPAKIAFISTEAFKDEKTGIMRWIAAAKSLQREFEPVDKQLEALENRIQVLNKDLEALSKSPTVVDPKTIYDKQEEIARLQREQKFKKEDGEARFKKRYEEVVGPVSKDIGKALDAFRKARGITLLLEYSRMIQMGALLSADDSMDVTAAFIADYNSRNPATASTVAPGR